MKKRILSLTLIFTMLAAFMPTFASAAADIKTGDYLQMGTYYDKPILWRCVDIDENGPLMLSDKIICLKAYDAKGSVSTGSHKRNNARGTWGSNYWGDSNIRSWLNSDASAGNVTWLCGNPPTKENLAYGSNAYDNEAGFLTNFNYGELSAIKEVKQKSILGPYDTGLSTSGSELHEYAVEFGSDYPITSNYDKAYAEEISDKMFLLDVKQLYSLYVNRNILGEGYYKGVPTDECRSHNECEKGPTQGMATWYYWLRTPTVENSSFMRETNKVRALSQPGTAVYNGAAAYVCSYGIRPAFYLAVNKAEFESGSGTDSDPYVIKDIPTPPPTATPTAEPTATPTPEPTATPTPEPTATPTPEPTATPTPEPTATPTPEPTATPTPEPTATPTPEPTATPTPEPTATPTPEPTATPTPEPTATPTPEPTATPTPEPTATPTPEPTATPTPEPTATPTAEPTATPTAEPTATPLPKGIVYLAEPTLDLNTVTAHILNNSGENAVFIAAVYDGGDSSILKDVKIVSLSEGDSGVLTLSLNISNGDIVKAFLWDGNLSPAARAIEIRN